MLLTHYTVQQGEILAFLTTYFGTGFDSIQNRASSSKTDDDHGLRIVQERENVQLSRFAADLQCQKPACAG